jgi:hypothetical protein
MPRADRERGSFTAELAAGLPALMLLLLTGLAAVDAVTAKARCVAAARDTALSAARGGAGIPDGLRTAPEGAEISVRIDDGLVTATVRAPVRAIGARLPRVMVTATAVAAVEPGGSEPIR